MTIELVIVLGIATWGAVEVMKHTLPSWYDRDVASVQSSAHKRINELEKKIEEIVGGAKTEETVGGAKIEEIVGGAK